MRKKVNNFVKICTAFNSLTGIILPCEDEISNKNLYVIISNRHLIDDLDLETDFTQKKSKINYFDFEIYRENGQLIPRKNIKILSYYCSKTYIISEDILVFLIEIEGDMLEINNKVSFDYRDNMEIYTEGFPLILSNDSVANVIKQKGILKMKTMLSKYVGRYATEEYNYYDRLSDLDIFSGLSGGPVKRDIHGTSCIIGMNVALPESNSGENPFRLIHFIKINYILEYLNRNGVIIYDILENNELRIKWIEGSKNRFEGNNSKYNKTILVLGSSGAGKSSFIKSFALNKDKIDSTGDGQTTRSKVKYSFAVHQPFKVEIEFYKEEEFIEQRTQDIYLNLIEFIFTYIYSSDGDIDIYEDKYVYLRNIYNQINNDINGSTNKKNEELKKNIGIILLESSPTETVEDIFNNYMKIIKKISDLDIFNNENTIQNENTFEELIKVLMCKDGLFDLKEYKYLIGEPDGKIEFQIGSCINENIKKLIHLYYGGEYNKQSFENQMREIIDKLVSHKDKDDDDKIAIKEKLKEFYGIIYKLLNATIKKHVENFDLSVSKNSLEIMDEKYNIEVGQLITECLKVTRDKKEIKSLSSMVKTITIYDSVANEYAMIFEDMKIETISFIDTKGLDHVEKGIEKKQVLENIITEEKEEYEDIYGIKSEDGIDAVIYLKKLDSGRPTELSQIIPLIYKVAPQISMYTVFTGIDIFYHSKEDIIIDWNYNISKIPKSVEYIKSASFKQLLFKALKASDRRKEIIYKVIQKNIVAFYGNEDISYFAENNKSNIKKMLTSIIMKESFSIDFIDDEKMKLLSDITEENKYDNKKNINYKELYDTIESVILELFEVASDVNFGNTNAPAAIYRRISGEHFRKSSKVNEYDFGFYKSTRTRIDLCFSDAYNKVLSEGSKNVEKLVGDLAKSLKCSEEKIESILINMKNDFLGLARNLYELKYHGVNEKNNFKKLIKHMYENSMEKNEGEFVFNPFNIDENERLIKKAESKSKESYKKFKEEYLKYCFDFKNRLKENDEVKNQIVKLFINTFKERVIKDKEHSIKSILNTHPKIKKSLELNRNIIEGLLITKFKDVEEYENDNNQIYEKMLEYNIKEILNKIRGN